MPTLKLVILGSGPAGLTAAIYAGRANLAPIVLAGPQPGGQLSETTAVDNYPGFPAGVQGPDLMRAMHLQAERFGATIINHEVTGVNFQSQPFSLVTPEKEYHGQAAIIATGASARWLGLPNEHRLRGHGVSACATCDGFFFRGKEVVVIGGGDSAMAEAIFLTKFCTKVTILVLLEQLNASKIMAAQARANPKIEWRWQVQVTDIIGDNAVTGVKLKNLLTKEIETFSTAGVFLAIGRAPNTKIFSDQIELTPTGYIKVHDHVLTSRPGVFVAGDVADQRYWQAVTAAGWGCMAAIEAEKYLSVNH